MADIDKDAGKLKAYDDFVDLSAQHELTQLRNNPAYAKATPEQRRAAEEIIGRRAVSAKLQARAVSIHGYPSASGGAGLEDLFGGGGR